jgi:hypothetical protein
MICPVGEIPEVPELPEEPDVPELPEEPEPPPPVTVTVTLLPDIVAATPVPTKFNPVAFDAINIPSSKMLLSELVPDEPDEPELPDEPDIPLEPDVPELPEEPDVPELPLVPAAAAEPKLPYKINTSDAVGAGLSGSIVKVVPAIE